MSARADQWRGVSDSFRATRREMACACPEFWFDADVHSDCRDSSEHHCSSLVLQQRPPPNRSVELTATRRTTMFSDD